MKLIDFFEHLKTGEYDDTKAFKMHRKDNVEMVYHLYNDEIHNLWKSWPGKHKNVYVWVVLESGYIVGMNENPDTGISFITMWKPDECLSGKKVCRKGSETYEWDMIAKGLPDIADGAVKLHGELGGTKYWNISDLVFI